MTTTPAPMTAERLEEIELWCDGDGTPDPEPMFEEFALGYIRQLIANSRALTARIAELERHISSSRKNVDAMAAGRIEQLEAELDAARKQLEKHDAAGS